MFADKGTDALAALDVALLGEVGQRPVHRDAGYAELITQRLLGGQRITRSEHAARDLLVQDQEELPMQRHPRGGNRSGLLTSSPH